MSEWSPEDIRRLIVTVTGCLGLMAVVLLATVGVMMEKITLDQFGSFSTAGAATGLLGLAYVLFLTVKTALKKGSE